MLFQAQLLRNFPPKEIKALLGFELGMAAMLRLPMALKGRRSAITQTSLDLVSTNGSGFSKT